ncbi:hypothetical protein QTP70_026759 [Hemibagrus guttatus]|uniref:Uncharacterized protein n=1 Tax=Hemibagrus guttatus TaxID=175788 RepID=A0AAE0ULZ2_9TELE|nr:hypothetical protein QTP70_026759 [Hemibagrus guttatus]KAK3528386.1 hypothetical protein QTP86_034212 [Hemibagrus guttatus]
MHTILLLVVTSELVLLQTTQGLTANVELDTDFIEEAMADGFLVSTKEPYKTEKTQDKNNGITHDSLNPEANISYFLKTSVPSETIAKNPEAITELTSENTNELPKNESATVLITVGSIQTTTISPDENAEGSGMFPKLVLEKSSLNGLSMNIDGSGDSGMFSEILDETQDKDLQFITTVRNSPDLKMSTLSSEENGESGMGPEASTSDWMTTVPAVIVDEDVIPIHINNVQKNMEESGPKPGEKVPSQYKPQFEEFEELAHEPDTQVKEGTPGWLLILALCLIIGAVICVFVGIGTKDMWYGPSKRCLNINSTESKKHEEYDKAATLPLSEKEMVALMSSQKPERNETDYTIISLEELPEKEYLM